MSTALYRRYRPETFDEVIGQEHVTDPLKAAIERGRINHAYLFSGPRGCGKTTSARILARCLNCEKGPTPVPCGECPSCRDLANGGPGSLDVVEIDAASHNGVDDARDLRERAIYAPARDRYKVFILDEAHMVTSQGFNALLKIVEEPPPHIKFVFATTEPEKVIGTIRSRTHHYPFRLVPPEALTNYLEDLCGREEVNVAKGVLPLVVRAGGGSVRDTLSVLDQLIAGSGPDGVDYGRAIALLGYTPDSLLSDIVDAFSAGDGGGVYRAVERVIESGQDPRRFVEDLLERFRDLIVINAAPEAAHAFLPEVPPDRLERLTLQAAGFGQGELSRAADLLNEGLTEMSGATSPRLQLELICARILLPGSGRSRDAVLSRMERMERRIGMSATGVAANLPPAQAAPDQGQVPGSGQVAGQTSGQGRPAGQEPAGAAGGGNGAQAPAGQSQPTDHDDFDDIAAMAVAAESMLNDADPSAQAQESQEQPAQAEPERSTHASEPTAAPASPHTDEREQDPRRESASVPETGNQQPEANSQPADPQRQASEPTASAQAPASAPDSASASGQGETSQTEQAAAPEATSVAGSGDIGGEIEAIRRAWPSILAAVEKRSRLTRAIIAANAIPQSFSDGVVYLGFNNPGSVQGFQQRDHGAKLAAAINDVLGIQARIDVGDVGRIGGGNASGGHQGKGAAAPPMNDAGGNRGPAPSQRRPSPQEVAAVVGTREVDKPQVDHEKFWEPSGPTQGPWSSDDEEGEQPGSPSEPTPEINRPDDERAGGFEQAPAKPDNPESGGTESGIADHVDDHAAKEGAATQPHSDESDTPVEPATVADEDSAEADVPEIVVPDLSDDDFFGAPADQAPEGDGDSDSDSWQPSSSSAAPVAGPDESDSASASGESGSDSGEQGWAADGQVPHPEGEAPTDEGHATSAEVQTQSFGGSGSPYDDDSSPMEYVQPRWEEPNWHDGPDTGPPVTASADVDTTSAGSGAVDVGAVVVPPPDDDLDYPDLSDPTGDFGAEASVSSVPTSAPAQTPPPSRANESKPFKSRFAALAEKHGVHTTAPGGSDFGSAPQPNGVSGAQPSAASAPGANPYPQATGPDEDEYDPETDLDVSEAPQIGVDVIARVLGGEIIDEREV
ncbi:DNA polymerase III subunit gamma and tau [Brevibacterium atlanticum]|uniref:DNA polymerase III subunit gamma and tau n=1 Tax=Brevibacterium atlanticum TaxID=2697563 RepID=UPI001420015E|nr:DNA polymerase III subunit gamma and tau [Brevibacterium atlanticum]